MSSRDSLQAQLEAQKRHSVSHLQSQVACSVTSFYDSLLLKVRSLGSPLGPGHASLTWSGSLQEAIHRDGEYYRSQLGNALTDTFNVNLSELLQLKETPIKGESLICSLEPNIHLLAGRVDETDQDLEWLLDDEQFFATDETENQTQDKETPKKGIEVIDLVSDEEDGEAAHQTVEQAPSTSASTLRRSQRNNNRKVDYTKFNYIEKSEESDTEPSLPLPTTPWRPLLSAKPSRNPHRSNLPEKANTRKRPYVCLVRNCTARFPNATALTVHHRSHTGERPYSCESCGQTFTQLGHRNVHQKRCLSWGEGPRPTRTKRYPCLSPGCKASFHFKSKLSIHQRVHTGERPFSCELCKQTFSQKLHRDRHSQSHATLSRHRCTWPSCTFPSADQATVLRHISVAHLKAREGEQAEDAPLFCLKVN